MKWYIQRYILSSVSLDLLKIVVDYKRSKKKYWITATTARLVWNIGILLTNKSSHRMEDILLKVLGSDLNNCREKSSASFLKIFITNLYIISKNYDASSISVLPIVIFCAFYLQTESRFKITCLKVNYRKIWYK